MDRGRRGEGGKVERDGKTIRKRWGGDIKEQISERKQDKESDYTFHKGRLRLVSLVPTEQQRWPCSTPEPRALGTHSAGRPAGAGEERSELLRPTHSALMGERCLRERGRESEGEIVRER